MSAESDRLDRFIQFSADVTGFSAFEVRGTGLGESFVSTIEGIIGVALLDELLDRFAGLAGEEPDERTRALRRDFFGDEKFGPIARNIVKLWYIGIWYELPREWMETFGTLERNDTFTVSAAAYTESLLWQAIDGNPPGAKGPGYGSWAGPPRIANGAAR